MKKKAQVLLGNDSGRIASVSLTEGSFIAASKFCLPSRDQSHFPHGKNPVRKNRNLRRQESLFHSSWGINSKKLFLCELYWKETFWETNYFSVEQQVQILISALLFTLKDPAVGVQYWLQPLLSLMWAAFYHSITMGRGRMMLGAQPASNLLFFFCNNSWLLLNQWVTQVWVKEKSFFLFLSSQLRYFRRATHLWERKRSWI